MQHQRPADPPDWNVFADPALPLAIDIGKYSGPADLPFALVLAIVWFGVVVSDILTWSFAIDIGSGNGRFLLALSRETSDINCLGIDIRRPVWTTTQAHSKPLTAVNCRTVVSVAVD